MAVSYTTTDWLNTVYLRGSIPQTTNSNNVNNTANLLQLGSEELLAKLVPLIMSTREEYFATTTQVPIVMNQAFYPIPYRAIGQTVRDLHIISGNQIYKLAPINPEFINTTSQGDVLTYYFQNNQIVLYPTPGSSTQGTLLIRYLQRPSQLALTTSCAQITAVSAATNSVTVSSLPSTWTVGTVVDFVHALPPFDNPGVDYTITGISGSTVSFAALPVDANNNVTVYANDWLAPAEYSPIPQIPRELCAVLAQMVVVKVLMAQGDAQGAAQAQQDLGVLQTNALAMITQRNEGDNHKIVSRQWYRR